MPGIGNYSELVACVAYCFERSTCVNLACGSMNNPAVAVLSPKTGASGNRVRDWVL